MADNPQVSKDQQRLVIVAFLQNNYIFTSSLNDIRESFFSDSSCRIIYRAMRDYYENYESFPSEDELMISVESNYIELGDSLEVVKDNLHNLFKKNEMNEKFLTDKVIDFVRKVKVRKSLERNLEKIRNGTGINDNEVLNDLIHSLDVDYNKSGILCLSDLEGLSEARREAIGDNSNEIIKSILPSINTSLQYRGYQKGTMNLIVSPPGCFVGETRIMTDDGYHRIDALYDLNKPVHIYGCNEFGDVREGVAEEVYLSEYTDDLVRVIFSNDKYAYIKCTPDHPFMLKNGSYKQAKDLTSEDELMESCRPVKIRSVERLHLKYPVPVYGLVNARPFHNYALYLGEGDGIFVSNTGKTSYLVNEGAYAALQGFNILHVFLGDMILYDGFVRYLSNISQVLQDDIIAMDEIHQQNLLQSINEKYNGVMNRIGLLSYGSGEVTVDQLIEHIKNEQDRTGMHFDDILVDYADNFIKDNTQLYSEGGAIYDKLALFGRSNHSVIMVASQPKIQYWNEEIIPLEGASESSKKQHIVDLLMTFNLVDRNSKIGTFFVPKVRRGTSGRFIRVMTEWERCTIKEITEQAYNMLKADPDSLLQGQSIEVEYTEDKPNQLDSNSTDELEELTGSTSFFEKNQLPESSGTDSPSGPVALPNPDDILNGAS